MSDVAETEESLRQAAQGGSISALYKLGKLYVSREQNARAYDVFYAAAAKEYPPAQFILGEMYLKGIPVQRNVERAIELLEQAAAKGHVYARGRLARIYLHGLSGRTFSGILHPKQFVRGLRLWCSAFYDAIVCKKDDDRLQI